MPAKKKKEKGSLLSRLKKQNTVKEASILSQSKFFADEFHNTGIYALNIALSAKLDGGFSRGSVVIAGESKTFKTMFMLQMVKAYLDENPEAFFIFYDIEFGTNQGTIESVGINPDRVFHKPIHNIDQLTHDFVNLFEGDDGIDENDDVIIGIDSFGAIASSKQQEDAKKGIEKVDMTRAKRIKNFWINANPLLNINKVPMIGIGQTYADQSVTYKKDIVGGGRSMEYFPNNIWLISKAQVKSTSNEFLGSTFKITVHKGRFTKEKSQFPIKVTFEEGIDKYSALLDIALDLGYVEKGKIGNAHAYYPKGKEEMKCRVNDTSCHEFWCDILEDETFKEKVFKKFALGSIDDVESTGEVVEGGYVGEDSGEFEDSDFL